MRVLARAISVLLHPLWMPTLTLWLCFLLDPHLSYTFTPEGRWIMLGMVFAMTGLFPLISAYMMRRTGLISALTLPLRSERIMPMVLTLMYHGLCYYLIRRTPCHPVIWCIFFGAMTALAFTLLITLRWKISVHMVGIGGTTGCVLALMVMHSIPAEAVLCALFVLAGLLGTARLADSDHSPAQVYTGALLGFVCVFACAILGVFI